MTEVTLQQIAAGGAIRRSRRFIEGNVLHFAVSEAYCIDKTGAGSRECEF